ncbi:hypothetical protein imdm_561 [gamma proteobacterium IMCC2047]|nr:hypothetical protein imdm_561 [gamma proteobacterium IMCC2047]
MVEDTRPHWPSARYNDPLGAKSKRHLYPLTIQHAHPAADFH